ncbi:Site-specific DNA-methyltransferase (Adenine-specific) [Tepidanaerobacter acetatoxydans Re1]|uniref:Site-specific DNA-methyltransferase (Adenine-specific) n=1 Tax=Tepidanaerobacter acetatoxydans (strain DSM 21804 / JCM 16047 / Re1) TaxID=1209989 RepID=F4LX35_TEPAE|nr:site-specific DNA-methyltransferase [Tepidanaerobacter acetatoxydans]AEE91013.1 Site-specific DNA-methyltransferase (adenine-specific) [Tepidanaerobacter acetatoxydans Re1]CCP25622.1 Site-specific DNA-methyltransferase (Adenine-specific) [Tepidanaerobacter acetatoxydans Re1]
MKKLKMKSKNLTKENIERIGKLFPNVITEIKDEDGNITHAIDFELLQQELSDEIVEGSKERYQLTWPGKKEAIVRANTPIDKTLRPVKEDSVSWEDTENLYIEGDNLEVLKLLQESYLNKIKCIYIDPPYNTGKDFIYKDNFTQDKDEYAEESGQVDEDGNRLFQNTEYNGRFHSDWLTMMYPRLKLARNLLSEDGVIFVSIDDNEVHNLRKICDEIFGERNFVNVFVWRKSKGSGNDSKYIIVETEYILLYAKNLENVKFNNQIKSIDDSKFKYKDEYFEERGGYNLEKLDRGSKGYVESLDFGIEAPDGTLVFPNNRNRQFNDGWRWMWSKAKVEWGIKNGYIVVKKGQDDKWNVYNKVYAKVDNEGNKIIRTKLYRNHIGFEENILNIQANFEMKRLFGNAYFSFPKPTTLLKHLLNMFYLNDEVILDFFSGSATTAHAVMELNAEDGGGRKYIMVQLPEPCDEKSEAYKAGFKNIAEIGKERIRRAGKKINEETGADIDYGFRVYRVDSSNMKDVYYRPDELDQNLLDQLESNIKEDRTGLDLLTQVMLEAGLELSLPIETKKIYGKEVHFVAGDSLVACFDEDVDEKLVKEIAKTKPLKVVFRDNSFKSCPDRINLEEIFKAISPGTEIKVL